MQWIKKARLWIRYILIVILSGCATRGSVEKSPDFTPSAYRTYSWVDMRAQANDESHRSTAFADLSIQNEVDRQLQDWGWQKVTADPDIFVGYDILVEKSVDQRRDPVYSPPFTRYYFNRYRRRWAPVVYPSRFIGYDSYSVPTREITLTINLMDADSDTKVWQGWSTQEIGSGLFSSRDIHRSVRAIFNAR